MNCHWDDYDLATWTTRSASSNLHLRSWRRMPGVQMLSSHRPPPCAAPPPRVVAKESQVNKLQFDRSDTVSGKEIVFDTCSLLQCTPEQLTTVATRNKLVIPWQVINELDKFKIDEDRERQRKSRALGAWILHTALQPNSSIVLQKREQIERSFAHTAQSNDDRIVGCAKWLVSCGGKNVVLCTEDTMVKIKCLAENLTHVTAAQLLR